MLLCPCTSLQSLIWGISLQSPLFRLMTSCKPGLSWETLPRLCPSSYPVFLCTLLKPQLFPGSLGSLEPLLFSWFSPLKSICPGWNHSHPEQGSSLAPTGVHFHPFFTIFTAKQRQSLSAQPPPSLMCSLLSQRGGWGGVHLVLVSTESLELFLLFPL